MSCGSSECERLERLKREWRVAGEVLRAKSPERFARIMALMAELVLDDLPERDDIDFAYRIC